MTKRSSVTLAQDCDQDPAELIAAGGQFLTASAIRVDACDLERSSPRDQRFNDVSTSRANPPAPRGWIRTRLRYGVCPPSAAHRSAASCKCSTGPCATCPWSRCWTSLVRGTCSTSAAGGMASAGTAEGSVVQTDLAFPGQSAGRPADRTRHARLCERRRSCPSRAASFRLRRFARSDRASSNPDFAFAAVREMPRVAHAACWWGFRPGRSLPLPTDGCTEPCSLLADLSQLGFRSISSRATIPTAPP